MTGPRLANVNVTVGQAHKWEQLRRLANANPTFSPVEIKAYYVIGLVDDICQSVECLTNADQSWPEKYLPAFGLFASAVDLIGRCLTGNQTLNVNENLRVGFWYLFHPTSSPPPRSLNNANLNTTLITTSHLSYTVADLVSLRNYSAHGQAAQNRLSSIDNELLAQFPEPIGNAMETYWSALQNDAEYCHRLGRALIDPHANRVEPLSKILDYFAKGSSVGELFYRLDWHV
jgi:hypothetical protein